MAPASDTNDNSIDYGCSTGASSRSAESRSRGHISFTRKEWMVLVTATVVAVFGITAAAVSPKQSASAAESSATEHVHPASVGTTTSESAQTAVTATVAATQSAATVTVAPSTTGSVATRTSSTNSIRRASVTPPAPRPVAKKPVPSTAPATPRGLIVSFGTYQGSAIRWRVLEASGSELLLLADRVLSAGAFQSDWEREGANVYGTSEIGAWLTTTFATSAFSSEESAALLPHSGGITAGDRVFLLTAAEVKRYLPAVADRKVRPLSDAAADKTGFSGEKLALTGGYAAWWLADSVGSNAAQSVQADGTVSSQPVYYADLGARPAIRIDRTKIALALSAQGVE